MIPSARRNSPPCLPSTRWRSSAPIIFDYPMIADVTGNFVYTRLQTGSDDVETCYDDKRLDLWADRVKIWAAGGDIADLAHADPGHKPDKKPRDVFAFFISEGKVNAPNGARALQKRVD